MAAHWVDRLVAMSDGSLVANLVLSAVMMVECSVVTTAGLLVAHLVMLDVMLVQQKASQMAWKWAVQWDYMLAGHLVDA